MTRGTIQREQVYVYDTCSLCGDTNVLVYEIDDKLVCASDYREITFTRKKIQHCDRCGAENAVRDPAHRRNEYLCWTCHQTDGFAINNSVVKRAIATINNSILTKRVKCDAAGYGTDCDFNVKPRSAWGGKLLCNRHGKTPPKKEKKKS
ncbi:MAG: hypothetical protein EBY03_06690 [Actinobacteria bacterium]|jgi:hypothetical protein|nr:hypothetical protein [Actinomycetota bacterium]